jgi:hypothetical protein
MRMQSGIGMISAAECSHDCRSCNFGTEVAAGDSWPGFARPVFTAWCVPGALIRIGLAAIESLTWGLFG